MDYQFMRTLLVLYAIGAVALTFTYLRYRLCSGLEYALWGTVAIALPVLGPFLVIAARPGPRKHFKHTEPLHRKQHP
jgi:hypothetical protein